MNQLGALYGNGQGVARDYAKAREWFEKAAAKEEEAEAKREGKPGEATATALTAVAWYALLAKEFTTALSAADRAHALLADDLIVETNRAHALMFLGRSNESEAIYLSHKGQLLPEQDGKLWQRAIADDFAEFRKAGLTHPMMADIEMKLGVSP